MEEESNGTLYLRPKYLPTTLEVIKLITSLAELSVLHYGDISNTISVYNIINSIIITMQRCLKTVFKVLELDPSELV